MSPALYRTLALWMALAVNASAADTHNDTNGYNPTLSLNLSGTYASLQRDPTLPATGFAMNPNPAHARGFNLGESELVLAANVDPAFSAYTSLALAAEGGVSVENAYVESTPQSNGTRLKFGRFFSGLGYLNEQHAHVWDFVDQPLVYATLWGNQLGEDGIQARWLAPTDLYIELGGELAKGRGFPGTSNDKNGNGATLLFLHAGDDIGGEHSWRAGVSLHQTQRRDALSNAVPDLPGTPGGVSNLFSGDSQTAGIDFVWKYARNGNFSDRYVKLQAEFFQRQERGLLSYDIAVSNLTDRYAVTQRGGYVQSVYQFMPHWRTGLRYDRLDPGVAQLGPALANTVIADYGYQPTRTSWMIDYSPSEFSHLRLQLARDLSRARLPDTQLILQYNMSLGAHPAHAY